MSLDRTETIHKRGVLGKEVDAILVIIDSPAFQELTNQAKVLLRRQADAMVHYHEILCARVSEMDNPSPEIGEPVDYSKAAPPTDYSAEQPETSLFEKLRAWWS